eukprot:GCRY01002442.1.p1 GENE.GCRY01002442.1~~GCRY01002442.1.p1  ORF type:complete len:587 (+),score=71.06 GCRY01002442.1:241-2001(+)
MMSQKESRSFTFNEGSPPLCKAAKKDDLQQVLCLINEGASLESLDVGGWTPLFSATMEGHLNVVIALVEAGADVNHANIKGATPLWAASLTANTDILTYLLSKGADPTIVYKETGVGPLHIAAEKGRLDAVKLLYDKRLALHRVTNGDIPLIAAARNGHAEVCEYLVHNNAYESERDIEKAICQAASQSKSATVWALLVCLDLSQVSHSYGYSTRKDQYSIEAAYSKPQDFEKKSKLNTNQNQAVEMQEKRNGSTPNTECFSQEEDEAIKKSPSMTPFLSSSSSSHTSLAALHRGQDEQGEQSPPGFFATVKTSDSLDMLKLDTYSLSFPTWAEVLCCAAREGDLELTELVVEVGGVKILNMTDVRGRTAADYGRQEGHHEIVHFLAGAGANIFQGFDVKRGRNLTAGRTFLHECIWSGKLAKACPFTPKEWDTLVNSTDADYRRSPLHHACMRGDPLWVERLLGPKKPTGGGGALIFSVDSAGWTPLHEACYAVQTAKLSAYDKISEEQSSKRSKNSNNAEKEREKGKGKEKRNGTAENKLSSQAQANAAPFARAPKHERPAAARGVCLSWECFSRSENVHGFLP